MIEYVYFSPLLSVTFLFRLTYDATLAELTSLEETDAVYWMDDGQIHQDVIAKFTVRLHTAISHPVPNNLIF
jgi:hypothetical protein